MSTSLTLSIAEPGAAVPSSLGSGSNSLLVWVRVPRNGEICPISGLGHAYYYKLLKAPYAQHLVTVRLGEPGQERATTLVWGPSLNAMLLRVSGLVPSAESDRFEAALSAPLPDIWLRSPKNGTRCPFSALSHGAFYALLEVARDHLIVADLRLPGEKRAATLVQRATLHRYLVQRAKEQAGQNFSVSTINQ